MLNFVKDFLYKEFLLYCILQQVRFLQGKNKDLYRRYVIL